MPCLPVHRVWSSAFFKTEDHAVSSRYSPSTLGAVLRSFTFSHVHQLDAVASVFWPN